MAEPKWDRDEIDRMWRAIEELQAAVKALQNNARPVVPIYDSAQFPLEAVEGQVVIADG
jgi:hypothetical protein